MKLEEFTSEMLNEVKAAKDLVKGELPEIAKEYIRASKIMNSLGLLLGLPVMGTGIASAIHGLSNNLFGFILIGSIVGVGGFFCSLNSCCELLDAYLQPRRMAIKAITSLKKE